MTAATAMRVGVRIGVDVGSVRVGVAAADATGTLASPETVLRRDPRRGSDLATIAMLVADREAIEVVVGWPRSMRAGAEGAAARAARDYAADLARRVAPIPVRLVDERLSTVEAQRGMHAAGRTVKSARKDIDAAAAAVVLQQALDAERLTGTPPGEVVER
jgi:putative Holliday junction resolvase